MIITLKNANFSLSNIGTLNTWSIIRTLGVGATYSGPNYVTKGESINATISISEGYEISSGLSVSMGNTDITDSAVTVAGNTITINISTVTDIVNIVVPTTAVADGPVGTVELLNLDFTRTTVADYISSGVLELGDSTADTLTYDPTLGLICNDTDLRFGLKLANPIPLSGNLSVEVAVAMTDYASSGTSATETVYRGWSIISTAIESDHTHSITCLSPCWNDSNQTSQLRLAANDATQSQIKNFFDRDGNIHTYKLKIDANANTYSLYRDGEEVNKDLALTCSGSFGYIFGIHKGYNYASQYATEKGISIKYLRVTAE